MLGLMSDKRKLESKQEEIKYQKLGVIAVTCDTLNELIETVNLMSMSSGKIETSILEEDLFNYVLYETVYTNQFTKSSTAGTYSYDEYNKEYSKVLTINYYETTQSEFYLRKVADIQKDLNEYGIKTLFSMNVKLLNHEKARDIVKKGLSELKGRHNFDKTSTAEFEISENAEYLKSFEYLLRENSNETIAEAEVKIKITGSNYKHVDQACKKATKLIRSIGRLSVRKFDIHNDLLKMSHVRTPNNLSGAVEMPLSTFAHSFPYNYVIINDPMGDFKNISYDEILNVNYYYKPDTERASSSGVFVGLSGSGKSTEMKEQLKNQFLSGGYSYSIDQDSEFIELTNILGGENIIFGEGGYYINPFELVKPDKYSELSFNDVKKNQILFVSSLMTTLYGDKYVRVQEKVENIVGKMYDKYKYEEFTFTDVLKEVKTKSKKIEIEAIKIEYFNIIEMFENLIMKFDLFNHKTNIDLSSRLINFDIANVKNSDILLNTIMLVIFDFLNRKMTNNRINKKISDEEAQRNHVISKIKEAYENYEELNLEEQTTDQLIKTFEKHQSRILIMVDEAHRMFNNPMALLYLTRTVRESRKYEAAIWFATQRFKDFFSSGLDKQVETLYEMMPYKILLYQDKVNADFAKEKVGLTQSQVDALTQNNAVEPQKGRGLFVAGKKVYNFENTIEPEWLNLFSGGK